MIYKGLGRVLFPKGDKTHLIFVRVENPLKNSYNLKGQTFIHFRIADFF
jgi:hypothetical protein